MFKKAMGGGGREKGIRRWEKVTKGGFAIRAAASTVHFARWNVYTLTNYV